MNRNVIAEVQNPQVDPRGFLLLYFFPKTVLASLVFLLFHINFKTTLYTYITHTYT